MSHRDDIAIIGTSGRFPGAENVEQFWQNICAGVESISFLSQEEVEVEMKGWTDLDVLRSKSYVRAAPLVEDADLFDASFFGIPPREASNIDPQHRLFLECAWHALESAGYDPFTYSGSIGVFAAASANVGWIRRFMNNKWLQSPGTFLATIIATSSDYLATRVSHRLDLRGPSVNVQSACSSSLVAVHLAAESLLNGECDMALAGGVSIKVPLRGGYLYEEGGIYSPDGHCRPFDAKAKGTVFGNGLGAVVLKRLSDAIKVRDNIRAIIKSTAINNDGARKGAFTAPSIDGQVDVITRALARTSVEPETIGYVEAHGTATVIGDPIEVAALTTAYRQRTKRTRYCAIGSVKGNVGHLDAAAGVTSLIKTMLVLERGIIPPSINFEHANPAIQFEQSPFFVNKTARPWEAASGPRRAAINSFGVGGTNAHAILEQPPQRADTPERSFREWHILPVSAKTEDALNTTVSNLSEFLQKLPELELGDAAYTLGAGRGAFSHRAYILCRDRADAVAALSSVDGDRVASHRCLDKNCRIAFMFSGQGSQYPGMASQLYRAEAKFKAVLDDCCTRLRPLLARDLREFILASPSDASVSEALSQTAYAQPALFALEYALSQMWLDWGVKPSAMLGHSVGEYVAACIAGVFSLENALRIIAARGRLMQRLPKGSMLAVLLPPPDLTKVVPSGLSIAAINGPKSCLVSGPSDAIAAFQQQLERQKIQCRPLATSHAFHSEMMEPIVDSFASEVAQFSLRPPSIPYISNVTGTWVTDDQATDPYYWSRQLREAVRFADGLTRIREIGIRVLLECGPGDTLVKMSKQQLGGEGDVLAVSTLRRDQKPADDPRQVTDTLGKLWLRGVTVDWEAYYRQQAPRRVELPLYPFQRERFWFEYRPSETGEMDVQETIEKRPDPADWLYASLWRESLTASLAKRDAAEPSADGWLVFVDFNSKLGKDLAQKLHTSCVNLTTIVPSDSFPTIAEASYEIDPSDPDSYASMIRSYAQTCKRGRLKVVFLWSLPGLAAKNDSRSEARNLDRVVFPLIYLVQALSKANLVIPIEIEIVTESGCKVEEQDIIDPEQASLQAACRIIELEHANIICRCIDLRLSPYSDVNASDLVEELRSPRTNAVVAFRSGRRWTRHFARLSQRGSESLLKPEGTYLVTGGLGSLGFHLGRHLAKRGRPHLVLTGRRGLPEKSAWEQMLKEDRPTDSSTLVRIRRIQELEAMGATVTVAGVDVCDHEAMKALCDRISRRFGRIDGVIHAAGFVDQDALVTVRDTQPRDADVHFRPKVDGLRVLERVFEDRSLDFLAVASSISSVLGVVGQLSYAIANTYMDAFVVAHNARSKQKWLSISWDYWWEAPPDTNFQDLTNESLDVRNVAVGGAMLPAEGLETFDAALALAPHLDHLVVSIADLELRQKARDSFRHRSTSRKVAAAPIGSAHGRPDISVECKAPQTDLESKIAGLWSTLLGIARVGIEDDFFELGGDSLLMSEMAARLSEMLNAEVPLSLIMKTPTVEAIAKGIENLRSNQSFGCDNPISTSVASE
jgi:acyl transferase domain-containing protein/acyl carrier protein